jgi:hypothetical protein
MKDLMPILREHLCAQRIKYIDALKADDRVTGKQLVEKAVTLIDFIEFVCGER